MLVSKMTDCDESQKVEKASSTEARGTLRDNTI